MERCPNIPADLVDGDDDTLAGISCGTGEILGGTVASGRVLLTMD